MATGGKASVMRTTDRFWAKVDKHGPVPKHRPDLGSCWLWTASTKGAGYGQFWNGNQLVSAHVWAYEQAYGPIPDDLETDHLCRVRTCVNAAHMELVTHRVNILRADTLMARESARTHCPQGHEYTIDNTKVYKGMRYCRACDRDRARQRRAAGK